MTERSGRYRLGFDIGGTFTDFVAVDERDGRVHLHKCLTTPEDPSVGALAGMDTLLGRLGLSYGELDHLVHGTTLVTNAIIERSGCRLGLLTTKGFRDVLGMGTEQRYDIHDLFLAYPEPLVARRYCREVAERVSRDGAILTPIDLDQVRHEVAYLVDHGVEAIAICFLHAYTNAAHERAAADLIAEEFPGLAVTLSSVVHPQLREYERVSTTTANGYVQPMMAAYVDRFSQALDDRGFAGRFHLIQSSGGLTAPETACRLPVRFLESGPAGGAQATAFVGRLIGRSEILSFDMGGTTAKACLIQNGAPDVAPMVEAGRVHRFKKGSGLPIHAPVIDMIEIGAGGGSIARVDSLGLLKIGPDSAGADPGPACYGQGGTAPTVTDANLVLGYLNADYFLGGEMALDEDRAARAIVGLADGLALSAIAAAWGIYDLVSENMAGAARVHIVEKGRDPRRYAMVAMGGAGPLHAAHVAAKLGVREVVIPPASGAASALGFLTAPISFEIARSLPVAMDQPDLDGINRLLAEMADEGRATLVSSGVEPDRITVTASADMRLAGQMHEIAVPLAALPLTADAVTETCRAFEAEYARLYTHLYDGARIEALNWRVVCAAAAPPLPARLDTSDNRAGPVRKSMRRAYLPERGALADVPVYDRYALATGDRIDGPAIIEERESTTIVPTAATVEVDEAFNLRLTLPAAARAVVVARDDDVAEAAARIEADPIGLEILWSRLINITEECWHTVIRTAFSLIIGEAQDFACEILDAKGRQIAHSPRAMPVFNLTLPMAVNAMIEKHPAQTLQPGDVLITNDPWICAGHLFDIAVAVPVFHGGRIVAYVGIVGHVTDIGGTTDELNAREIYDEGLQIPPMKLFRAGVANTDLFDLIAVNVRRPDQVLGDIHALVAAGMTGAERMREFMDEYGMQDLEALAEVVQRRAEQAMRSVIATLPDGDYSSEVEADGIEETLKFPIQITVQDDEIIVNFEGAPPETDRGGSNCTLSYTMAHATYPLKCMLTPDVPGNAGCYRPMTVNAPKGSIFNCNKPKAVNTRVRTGWYIAPNIFKALAGAAEDKVQAFTGLPSSALFYGADGDGQIYRDHLFQGGGQGASSAADGCSALLYPTSAANTSVEMFEARVPALVTEKAFVADSGGPGRQRGGLGQSVRTRKLYDDGLACQVGLYPNGVKAPIAGLFGGQSGGKARAWTGNGADTAQDLGVGGLATLTAIDQHADMDLAGGAGFGDPMTRAYDAVQRDLDDGLVSTAGAKRDYGCVVDADGVIDRFLSDHCRAEVMGGAD